MSLRTKSTFPRAAAPLPALLPALVAGLSPLATLVVSVVSMIFALLVAIQVAIWLATIWHGAGKANTAYLFILGLILLSLVGVITGVMLSPYLFNKGTEDQPKWEADGYRPDEYGRWIKFRRREADLGRAQQTGWIRLADGSGVVHEDDIEDIALPLYEGRMIGQFDFSQKGWVSGKGRSAVWREIPWTEKVVEPQYLIAEATARRILAGGLDRVALLGAPPAHPHAHVGDVAQVLEGLGQREHRPRTLPEPVEPRDVPRGDVQEAPHQDACEQPQRHHVSGPDALDAPPEPEA